MQYSTDERRAAHSVSLPKGYIPRPREHMLNPRDYGHFMYALKWLESIKAKKVLDVGCYDGWLDFLLIERGFAVTGIEFIEDLAQSAMLYANRNMIDYKVHTGSAQDFDFEIGEFDAVLCFEMLEHVPMPAAIELTYKFNEWAPNVLLSLPNQDHNDNHQHCWTPTPELLDFWFKERTTKIEYKTWPGPEVPGNWFIQYEAPRE